MARRTRTRTAADLRAIAGYQKVLILCLVGHLFIWLGYCGAMALGLDDRRGSEPFIRIALVLTLLVGLVAAVFVLLIGVQTRRAALGVILGILTIIPCLGLVMILVASMMATTVLQANGVWVGLLGAKAADLADLTDGDVVDPEDEEAEEREEREERERRRRRRASDINEDEGW
jgi:hypothetical protein